MKRAKVFLSAIAVFAIVGGALAFKAAKFSKKNIYCIVNNQCQKTGYQLADNGLATTDDPCLVTGKTYFTESACATERTGVVFSTTDN